jgi:hypothetical protein
MMDKLVMRLGLGAMLVLAALPITARAQTAPPPAPPPVAAPVEPAPVAVEPAPPPAVMTEAPPPAAPPVEMEMGPGPSAPPPVMAETVVEEAVVAAPASPLPTVAGYVEAGYNIHFTDPNVAHPVPLRVYDAPGHSFALHAAHVAISHKFNDNIGALISIDAGRDAVIDAGGAYPYTISPQFGFDIREAYAFYGSNGWTLTAGKFVTYEGIEVIDGPLNPTITRGLLYGLAEPFTHTGVKLHYQPADEFNIGIGVVNGWDLIGDNNGMKTIIARMAITPSTKFFAALSGSVGSEQAGNNSNHRISIDLTGAITASESFQLWYQGNFGSEKHALLAGMPIDGNATWWGVGLQPVITAGDFTLGSRLEYFADPKGVRAGLGPQGKFFNVTLTPGIKLAPPFKIRFELRADIASDKVLGKSSDPTKTQFSGALSAEYTF